MKSKRVNKSKNNNFTFLKCLTGIQGLDEITSGGIPKNRPPLLQK
jgi:circadian clock protein KaiC